MVLSAAGVPLQNVYAANKTGTVTANSLNVRTGAGIEYEKLQVNGVNAYLTKGQSVTILKESNGWYYIKFKFSTTTAKGYVLGEYIAVDSSTGESTGTEEVTATPTPTPTPTTDSGVYSSELTVNTTTYEIPGAVTASVLNLRSKASTSGSVVTKLSFGTFVTILNEINTTNGKWYKIEVDDTGETGYVLSSYISIVFDGNIKGYINSESKVYLRKSAKTSAAYVKKSTGTKVSLKNEKAVTILSEKTVNDVKWFKISVKVSGVTYKGYIQADLIRFKQTVYEEEEVTQPPTPTQSVESSETPTPTATPTATPTPTASAYTIQGAVLSYNSVVTLYVAAGFDQYQLTDASGNLIYIYKNTPFAVYNKITVDGYDWYYVGIKQNGTMYYGYTLCEFISLNSEYDEKVQSWPTPDMSSTETDTTTPTAGATTTVTPTPTNAISSSEAFEAKLTDQGFPESYKTYLRALHEKYPLWEFEAYQTGLDWNTVITNESAVSLNLITNTKSIEWKSLADGAYNWKTDKFIPYDGSTWVTASEEAVAYYMDPRNFLTESGIFQFELLSYRSSYQNEVGVENILSNTALSNKSFSYTDDSGVVQSMTYAQAFIAAAEYANVSPYHLATRVKQEVVTGTSSLSNSVTGTVSGYEGLYNFYNIGAYHSTTSGGAVINALKYALNGSGNATLDTLYRIPWDNPYDAIVGGAYFIGRDYINRGDSTYHSQDTIYLQKFNVTNKTTYTHQYMANVEAAYSEAKKMYEAYGSISNLPIVFSIPVYDNMPSTACAAPTTQYNPNNWLSTLTVTDSTGNNLALTPTFDVSETTEYYLIVTSDIEYVNIAATTVSSKATIVSGPGAYPLSVGTNQITVIVTAENGDVRSYNIIIVRS